MFLILHCYLLVICIQSIIPLCIQNRIRLHLVNSCDINIISYVIFYLILKLNKFVNCLNCDNLIISLFQVFYYPLVILRKVY